MTGALSVSDTPLRQGSVDGDERVRIGDDTKLAVTLLCFVCFPKIEATDGLSSGFLESLSFPVVLGGFAGLCASLDEAGTPDGGARVSEPMASSRFSISLTHIRKARAMES